MNVRLINLLVLTVASLSAGCASFIEECGERETFGRNGECVAYVPRALGFFTPHTFQTNVSPDTELLLAVDDVTGFTADRDQLVADFLAAHSVVHEGSGEALAIEWTGEWAEGGDGVDLARLRAGAPLPTGRIDVIGPDQDSTQVFFVGDDHAPFVVRATVDLTGDEGQQFGEVVLSTSEPIDLEAGDVVFRDLYGDEFTAVVASGDGLNGPFPTYRVSVNGYIAVSPYFEVVLNGVESPISALPMTVTSNPIAFANAGNGQRSVLSEADGSLTLELWPLGLRNFTAVDVTAPD